MRSKNKEKNVVVKLFGQSQPTAMNIVLSYILNIVLPDYIDLRFQMSSFDEDFCRVNDHCTSLLRKLPEMSKFVSFNLLMKQ